MKTKQFIFKEKYSNIKKLHKYIVYKFSRDRRKIEYDECGLFVSFQKKKNLYYFYYIKNNTDLWITFYRDCVQRADKLLIKDFKQKVYEDDKLKSIFDTILKPLTR